ncbi:enoyl-CoA hydratase [Anaerobacillus alkaliphilus]|uniref:Enoyl-CoA hydratase n=1 Tax=Anaerobacillus alkaliphilus TaxID=1548597 RepID=A0A4Q0VUI4_9BACI|nr:enoyl-CoA hydratase [Anaerobacillus alkaliphilus]RXI99977.1 enoyl-CoA hydratase [Anaerobacillus alkaliphilus]
MAREVILSIQENEIATILLNRSEKANAMSVQLLTELQDILENIKYNPAIRCVIITGSGEKAFCAGADLKERATMNPQEVRKTVALIRKTINDIEELPKPVIAAINGVAFGGGTELALACDFRIAATNAVFGLTETSLGIIPGAGGTQRLSRLIGKGKAKELIYTARRVDAIEAEKIGLVEYVETDFKGKALELAQMICKNGPIAVSQAKLAIDKGFEMDLQSGLAFEQAAYERTIPTKDRLEGLQAFKEKRPPKYIGE